MAKRHPKQQIQEAIEYAESRGWIVTKSKGHAWGRMACGFGHRDCQFSIWSTPKNPSNHARHLRKMVERCPGEETEETDDG